MKAIPLRSPDGRVYTYACGVCHDISSMSRVGGEGPPDAEDVKVNREQAERCCSCRECGAEARREMHCPACKPAWAARCVDASAEYERAIERRGAKNAAALAACPNAEAARMLLERMLDLSEEHHCASWLTGLEHDLWWEGAEPHEWGMGELTAKTFADLRRMSEACDGWWAWSEADGGEMFLRLEEWRDRVRQT